MIEGTVNAALEAVIRLGVRQPSGVLQEFDAVVDTGFNGFLTLPPSAVADLELAWLCRQEAELADGSIQAFDVHQAVVFWLGREREIEVEAADAQPLIGMSLMRGLSLTMDIDPGGAVKLRCRRTAKPRRRG